MNAPNRIVERLFLGNIRSISKVKFDGVVSVMIETPKLLTECDNSYKIMVIQVNDTVEDDIKSHFDKSAQFIENILSTGGTVLVHCKVGASRSATIVIAYLMRYKKMSLLDAHKLVKSERSIVQPNNGFWKQLIEYEKELFDGQSTVSFVSNEQGVHFPSIYEKAYSSMVFLSDA